MCISLSLRIQNHQKNYLGAFIIVFESNHTKILTYEYYHLGHSWNRIDPSILPESLKKGEGGFASSGSCIAVFGQGIAWIGTGSNGNARILKTTDYGQSWKSFETPIIKAKSCIPSSINIEFIPCPYIVLISILKQIFLFILPLHYAIFYCRHYNVEKLVILPMKT